MADGQTMMTPSEPLPETVPAGQVVVGGKTYMTDAKGALVPIELVKTTDQLIDGEVRRIMGFATSLSEQVTRFKQHTLDDFAKLLALLNQEYSAGLGAGKGNVTLTTYDGLMKVSLQVADRLVFGPELQSAKALVDAYLTAKTADSDAELRGLVQHAFNTDKEGLVNRAQLFQLLRYEIKDERWLNAMRAIKDSIRVEGTKEYVRFYVRQDARADWTSVRIDVAAA